MQRLHEWKADMFTLRSDIHFCMKSTGKRQRQADRRKARYWDKGNWIIKVARKSAHRIKKKLREITKRNDPLSEEQRITKLNKIITGWVNYFVIAKAKTLMQISTEMEGCG